MPTAVLDLEFRHLPPEISGLDRYDRAFVLIRLDGRPVGQTTLDVRDGRIAGATLRARLYEAGGQPLLDAWLRAFLGVDERPPSAAPTMPATVAICTHERPDDLRRALTGLSRLPDQGQEVVVVDNCPATDATRRVVEEFPNVRYVREDRQGLDRARNRALREARHEVIAFIDDDAVPDPGWLAALLRNFDHPSVACVTGLTLPVELETPAQEWFERHIGFGRGFQRRVFATPPHNPAITGPIGAGVNMALRRSAIDVVGPFDEALDSGTATRSGGDHEMFSRLLGAGYQIVYDPAALNWHRHRRGWDELRKTVHGYGVGLHAAWTRSLVAEREWGVLPVAGAWLVQGQIRSLARAILRRPHRWPARLVLDQLRGSVRGPAAYAASRRQQRAERRP